MVFVSQFLSSAKGKCELELKAVEKAKLTLFCQIATPRSRMSFHTQEGVYWVTNDRAPTASSKQRCHVGAVAGHSSDVSLLYTILILFPKNDNFGHHEEKAKMLKFP